MGETLDSIKGAVDGTALGSFHTGGGVGAGPGGICGLAVDVSIVPDGAAQDTFALLVNDKARGSPGSGLSR